MVILGISAFYHDSASCIIKDGKIIAAAQEERFTRKKHDQEFPMNSIKYCLEETRINSSDLDLITFLSLFLEIPITFILFLISVFVIEFPMPLELPVTIIFFILTMLNNLISKVTFATKK